MKKLKLKLDDLRIDSFTTTRVGKAKGTVFGEQCTCQSDHYACLQSVDPSCDGMSCDATACGTCGDFSCEDSCVDCTCAASCGGQTCGFTCRGWETGNGPFEPCAVCD